MEIQQKERTTIKIMIAEKKRLNFRIISKVEDKENNQRISQ